MDLGIANGKAELGLLADGPDSKEHNLAIANLPENMCIRLRRSENFCDTDVYDPIYLGCYDPGNLCRLDLEWNDFVDLVEELNAEARKIWQYRFCCLVPLITILLPVFIIALTDGSPTFEKWQHPLLIADCLMFMLGLVGFCWSKKADGVVSKVITAKVAELNERLEKRGIGLRCIDNSLALCILPMPIIDQPGVRSSQWGDWGKFNALRDKLMRVMGHNPTVSSSDENADEEEGTHQNESQETFADAENEIDSDIITPWKFEKKVSCDSEVCGEINC